MRFHGCGFHDYRTVTPQLLVQVVKEMGEMSGERKRILKISVMLEGLVLRTVMKLYLDLSR